MGRGKECATARKPFQGPHQLHPPSLSRPMPAFFIPPNQGGEAVLLCTHLLAFLVDGKGGRVRDALQAAVQCQKIGAAVDKSRSFHAILRHLLQ